MSILGDVCIFFRKVDKGCVYMYMCLVHLLAGAVCTVNAIEEMSGEGRERERERERIVVLFCIHFFVVFFVFL